VARPHAKYIMILNDRERMMKTVGLFALIVGHSISCLAQTDPDLQAYLKNQIEMSDKQIGALRDGSPFVKALATRIPHEIFIFGAVFINEKPEAYVRFSRDFNRFRTLPGFLSIGEFSSPPRLPDLKGFEFDTDEINSLKSCRTGKCPIQLSAASMEQVQKSVDWSAPDLRDRANRILQEIIYEYLSAYQRDGNRALGIYNDKRAPADVAARVQHLIGYPKAWPQQLPDLHSHLLHYPQGRPADVEVEDTFYWAKVKFGLKPTLRIVHSVTVRGMGPGNPAFVVAEKQLYASHYFRSALDLSFCIPETSDPNRPGFYLIKVMGSEQAGLTGFMGSIIRKIALIRSTSSLKKALTIFKTTIEQDTIRE